jgi:hypothetical protein
MNTDYGAESMDGTVDSLKEETIPFWTSMNDTDDIAFCNCK